MLLLFPWVPDSPQLLVAQGELRRAQLLLHAAAKANGKKLPEGRLRPCGKPEAAAAEEGGSLGLGREAEAQALSGKEALWAKMRAGCR